MWCYLCRHGETHYNRKPRTQGQFDSRLTETGQRQAEQLADFLAKQDFAAIYSSTLLRSYRTARIVAERHGMRPTAISDLKEADRGLGTGMHYDDIDAELEEKGISRPAWEDRHGEDYHDLAARVVPAIDDLIDRHDRDICIVAHGGVNRVYLAHIQGVSPRKAYYIDQDNCCVNIIDDQRNIEASNLTEHLEPVRPQLNEG
ncbi:MAG: histidine phosphatase family protein [Candidatus Nanohaloarchaea archaeon]|nr:histidine phosphatase family protein [Candidatus Nanohaloarchaea archaeon]